MKPIADPRGREQQPDDAALDELRKAFGVLPADGDPHDRAGDAPTTRSTQPVRRPLLCRSTTTSRPRPRPPTNRRCDRRRAGAADRPTPTPEPEVEQPTAEQPAPASRRSSSCRTASPAEPPPAEPPKPEPPRIVRIDDYAASHAEPPPTAGAPGPPVDPLIAHPPKPASPPEPTRDRDRGRRSARRGVCRGQPRRRRHRVDRLHRGRRRLRRADAGIRSRPAARHRAPHARAPAGGQARPGPQAAQVVGRGVGARDPRRRRAGDVRVVVVRDPCRPGDRSPATSTPTPTACRR